jgi:hypothetical protein
VVAGQWSRVGAVTKVNVLLNLGREGRLDPEMVAPVGAEQGLIRG